MAVSTDQANIAPIVELSRFRRRTRWRDGAVGRSAELLSMRRALSHEASIEIDDLDTLLERLGKPHGAALVRRVRALLDHEFGRLRVHRGPRHFIARHRSIDALVAGLLRAQFHTLQFELPPPDTPIERAEPGPVTLTWGVGRSGPEAEGERLRRRREKRRSR